MAPRARLPAERVFFTGFSRTFSLIIGAAHRTSAGNHFAPPTGVLGAGKKHQEETEAGYPDRRATDKMRESGRASAESFAGVIRHSRFRFAARLAKSLRTLIGSLGRDPFRLFATPP
jgi:hypothetical protein